MPQNSWGQIENKNGTFFTVPTVSSLGAIDKTFALASKKKLKIQS